jgi:fructoselysine-6-P-deglycase FrlB-like protein
VGHDVLPVPRAATSACPVALEGALKLKEISYISTDAYAAGEMKHGPIALLDERTPVVRSRPTRRAREGLSNMQRSARAAHVIAVATEGNEGIGEPRRRGPARAADRLDAAAAARGSSRSSCSPTGSRAGAAERRPAAQPRQTVTVE